VSAGGQLHHLPFARGERPRPAPVGRVLAGDVIAAAVALKTLDERPLPVEQTLPQRQRRLRIAAPEAGARAVDLDGSPAQALQRAPLLRAAFGVLDDAVRPDDWRRSPKNATSRTREARRLPATTSRNIGLFCGETIALSAAEIPRFGVLASRQGGPYEEGADLAPLWPRHRRRNRSRSSSRRSICAPQRVRRRWFRSRCWNRHALAREKRPCFSSCCGSSSLSASQDRTRHRRRHRRSRCTHRKR
jgi:hypothetical protein